jgi:Zn-dependent protease with chaperone function
VLALNGWSRRAEITADRAGLLCGRDLEVAVALLVKQAIGSNKLFRDVDVEEYLRGLGQRQSGVGRFDELFATQPYLPKRIEALRLFARTPLYAAQEGTLSREECDAKVAELLAVFR